MNLLSACNVVQGKCGLDMLTCEQYKEAVERYNSVLNDIIVSKRKNPCTTPGEMDILDLMVQAVDEHTGKQFTDEQVRREALATSESTLLYATHDP